MSVDPYHCFSAASTHYLFAEYSVEEMTKDLDDGEDHSSDLLDADGDAVGEQLVDAYARGRHSNCFAVSFSKSAAPA